MLKQIKHNFLGPLTHGQCRMVNKIFRKIKRKSRYKNFEIRLVIEPHHYLFSNSVTILFKGIIFNKDKTEYIIGKKPECWKYITWYDDLSRKNTRINRVFAH
jgi:hypothetical protein